MPTYNPLELCQELDPTTDGRRSFICDPGIIYPSTIQHIRQVIASPNLPIELYQDFSPPEIDPRAVARDYQAKARTLPVRAWDLALLPRQDLRSPEDESLRAEALTLARLWFTQALHVAISGNPLMLRILKDDHWRL